MTNDDEVAAIAVHPRLTDEDRARAEFYAVLARLFTAAPDAAFLAALGGASLLPEDAAMSVTRAWNRLVAASRGMDAEAAGQEYTDLFVGVGKAECNLHASYWIRDTAVRPLVAMRNELAELGLARATASTVYEDHLGAICETMRILIAGAPGRDPAPIAVQQTFFERNVAPWAINCVRAISDCAVANYYARVAEFAEAFLAVERDSLAIE